MEEQQLSAKFLEGLYLAEKLAVRIARVQVHNCCTTMWQIF